VTFIFHSKSMGRVGDSICMACFAFHRVDLHSRGCSIFTLTFYEVDLFAWLVRVYAMFCDVYFSFEKYGACG
jgi:hypothetical protein